MRRTRIIVTLLLILIIAGTLTVVLSRAEDPTSPLTASPWFGFEVPRTSPIPTSEFKIIGYLPYWNINKVSLQPELTQLSYFSLSIDADGTIKTTEDGGTAEPGYHRLTSDTWLELANQAKAQGTTIELTFSQLDNASIDGLLSSPTATTTFLSALDSALLAYPVGGIHIDIEYAGSPTAATRQRFVAFIKAIDQHLNERYQNMPLRVAIYPGAAEKYQLWDLPALVPYVDSFIVMAYDFHRPSSPVAGPVAPLFGSDNYWEGDITHYLQTILKQVPSNKLLLGIPFYGYEWQTTAPEPLSTTFPRTGGTASYDRVQELITTNEVPTIEGWDDTALSPYLIYTEQNPVAHFVIYYENSRSIQYKLELARQLDLGGIAIWALGYEGNRRDLWDSIGNFTLPSPSK